MLTTFDISPSTSQDKVKDVSHPPSAKTNLTNSPSISHDKLAALVVVEPVPVGPPTTTAASSSGTVLSDLLKVENVTEHCSEHICILVTQCFGSKMRKISENRYKT